MSLLKKVYWSPGLQIAGESDCPIKLSGSVRPLTSLMSTASISALQLANDVASRSSEARSIGDLGVVGNLVKRILHAKAGPARNIRRGALFIGLELGSRAAGVVGADLIILEIGR